MAIVGDSPSPSKISSYPPIYRVEMVRDGHIKIPTQRVQNCETAAAIFRSHIGDAAFEHLAVILTDNQDGLIGIAPVGMGTIDSCPAVPRQVLTVALRSNAAGVIVGHNHTSGRTTPSADDIAFFKRLKRSCDDMGVRLLDCIIIGNGTDEFYSHGRGEFNPW